MPASPRKSTPSQNGDTPPPVSLNLDSLEREGGEPKPFVFVLGGDRFVCRDATNVDWHIVVDVDETDPIESLKFLLGDDFEKFSKHKLPVWKLEKLMAAWREHVGDLPVGESDASSTS